MRTISIGVWKVGLTAKYCEYNCGNKTTGRLELVVTDGNSTTNHGAQQVIKELQDNKIRDQVIENFLKDVSESGSYQALNKGGGAPFFPSDSGIYPPGVLVYADRIHMNKAYTWYNNWKGLIELFELEPKFGVKISKSPIIPNRYYGVGAPSRVWTIILPSISQHTCFDAKTTTPAMKASLSAMAKDYASPHLKVELATLGVAV